MERLYIAGIFLVIFLILVIALAFKKDQLKNYQKVRIGMSEQEMIQIMGSGYNVSSLKGNRYKYEWRVNSMSYGNSGVRSYTGVRKVDIYVKNGEVEEIRPYNV